MIVSILLTALAAYLGVGLLFSLPFVLRGVQRVDAHAAQGTWGFRLLIIPGTIFLWPLLASRWLRGTAAPPAEKNAHRRVASI